MKWNPMNWFRKKPKDMKLEELDYKVTYLLTDKTVNTPKPVFASASPTDDTKFLLSVDDVKDLVQVVVKHCKENI